jgi:ADP-ribosyl-[dinitrogen reductase] hydrolase
MIELSDRFRGCLLGLAAGDAVGTSVEFMPRGSFKPLTDMVGGGPFHLKAGQWTDDTSMALCLAESLATCQGFDAQDQMQRYLDWYRHGKWSSTGTCFDIGGATRAALERFQATGEAFSGSTNPQSAGNGSLMRLAPVALYFAYSLEEAWHYAGESSRTTHAVQECVDACALFAGMLVLALHGKEKTAILAEPADLTLQSEKIRAIARGDYQHKSEAQIRGSGYVVEALEAALWCFWNTQTFAEAILAAVNLGDDADTTAAICGQLAGAYYGESGIPADWLERLYLRQEIGALAERLGTIWTR